MLTRRQAECLAFIEERLGPEGRGIAPSFDEIRAHLGVKSKGNVFRILKCLEARGAIRRIARGARGIEIIRKALICPHCGFPAGSAKCVAAARQFPLGVPLGTGRSLRDVPVDAPAVAEGSIQGVRP